eukprot:scaffold114268_cov72-Phaeocystis_antarctica.AAC.3
MRAFSIAPCWSAALCACTHSLSITSARAALIVLSWMDEMSSAAAVSTSTMGYRRKGTLRLRKTGCCKAFVPGGANSGTHST